MSTTKGKYLSRGGSFQHRESPARDNVLLVGLVSDLERLLEDESSADLEFYIDQERVPAHRLIVLTRCERYRTKKRLQHAESTPVTIQLGKHFSAAAVRDVVRYLYTGNVSLHNDAPFSLLQVCAEFGLPLLQSYLTRHITSHLTPETVCQTLVGASSLMKNCRDDSLKIALKQIAHESKAYILTHTRTIFQGRDYLILPKDTFISIISNNELSIHEEEVWRAVVQWGQHKAGVKQTMVLWTEQDRTLIQQALQGVLEQVRISDISSEVFAKEVEPTGLLPMEMMLAHYRNAAVQGGGGGGHCLESGEVVASPPRGGAREPLADSAILGGKMEHQLKIVKWLEEADSEHCLPDEWVLLYRGSRDGFSAKSFHSTCDERGPTITVVKTSSGCVFGGYSDVSWNSRFKRGKFASSHEAFLFSLVGPLDTPPTKYPIQQPVYAINNHPANGPIFGSGADLCISNDCHENKESYSQLGHSYGNSSLSPGHLTGDSYFTVEEYEVFGAAST